MKNLLFFTFCWLYVSCTAQGDQSFSQVLPDEERIVFSSNRQGNFEIYSMRPDGSDRRQLTRFSGHDIWPKWSPNGKKIVYCSKRGTRHQIFLMNRDGSQKRNLSNNPYNELNPVISPDGKQIAFNSKESGSYQVHLMNIDGTNRKQLTSSGPFCGRPDWSPDGRKLVYVSIESGVYELYRINVDGSGKKQLTKFNTEVGNPAWSKDGYQVLFHAHENEVDKLFSIKANGTQLKRIKDSPQSDFLARWNGNAKKLVYTSIRDGNYDLYTYDLATQTEQKLTKSTAKDQHPDWYSPWNTVKGQQNLTPIIPANYRLVFTSYRGGSADVFMMKPDGTQLQRLTDTDDSNSFPRSAGDGQHVIFRRAPSESGTSQNLYKVNLNNQQVTPHQRRFVDAQAIEENISANGRYKSYVKKIDKYREVFVYDTQSKKHRQITQNRQQKHFATIVITFWSRDSKKLAFLSGTDYYNLYLRVYDTQTQQTTTVTSRGYMFSGVVWLKDHQSFVINIKIRNKTTYELWRINLDGTRFKQLTNHPKRGSAHPTLSPDGNWIAFESGRDGDDGEIYLMRPNGSAQTRLTYHRTYDGRPAWIIVK
ncbi:MAG TPA: hypothetical protein DCS93_16185 [Microscillaceae bacterium]|nr:hypothetical protein [Microscillaceae bacterium]